MNITKHSTARRVIIRIGFEPGMLFGSIEDDVNRLRRAFLTQKKALVLMGLRERLHSVGGALSVVSSPRDGTKLLIRFPETKESHSHVNSRRTC